MQCCNAAMKFNVYLFSNNRTIAAGLFIDVLWMYSVLFCCDVAIYFILRNAAIYRVHEIKYILDFSPRGRSNWRHNYKMSQDICQKDYKNQVICLFQFGCLSLKWAPRVMQTLYAKRLFNESDKAIIYVHDVS